MEYYWLLNLTCIILVSYWIGRWDGKSKGENKL